ncbi:MAG: ABC transporter permease, partial [Promethearchaeota archaeon]
FFSMAFPLMFVLMFYFMLGKEVYDYAFSGMVIYATGVGTINAAISFAEEKTTGMLTRLDTLPTGRKNIFLGTLLSESVFLTLQVLIMFVIGYGILGLKYDSFVSLFLGFFIALLFGISSLGLGLIIASMSKTAEIANAASLVIFMLMLFVSGSMFPFESPIVYIFPPYWARQVFLQVTVLGHGLSDFLYSGSLIGTESQLTIIPIWGGLLIIIAFTLIFVVLGVIVFQKKTKF